ncbi:phage regulatory CII family protein [Paraburkholderia sp. BL21I4N1]|uniref:phage regulatory CII family protein n=1 Tax=Paraburkholderia sp. BL21I4N1 TaxID=1938801 RepID=UPI000CFDB033|nr:phage regulatory CII family protein [Paraburkholderia sp. BL21I4N1]PQV50999.1 phage regulatory protein CII [Paraburkholderia sp. BL21I4N1]
MNILDAAHAVAHDYPGGCESLAPRMGMSAAVLRNKVNPNNTTHHLTVAEAVRMSQITGDVRIAEAIANELGHALVKLPQVSDCCDSAIVEMMGKAWETHGDVGREITKTLEDGRVEHKEVARVEARIFAHAQVLFNLAARLRGMAE